MTKAHITLWVRWAKNLILRSGELKTLYYGKIQSIIESPQVGEIDVGNPWFIIFQYWWMKMWKVNRSRTTSDGENLLNTRVWWDKKLKTSFVGTLRTLVWKWAGLQSPNQSQPLFCVKDHCFNNSEGSFNYNKCHCTEIIVYTDRWQR